MPSVQCPNANVNSLHASFASRWLLFHTSLSSPQVAFNRYLLSFRRFSPAVSKLGPQRKAKPCYCSPAPGYGACVQEAPAPVHGDGADRTCTFLVEGHHDCREKARRQGTTTPSFADINSFPAELSPTPPYRFSTKHKKAGAITAQDKTKPP